MKGLRPVVGDGKDAPWASMLSREFVAHLKNGEIAPLLARLRGRGETLTASGVQSMLEGARRCGWGEKDVHKLEAYGHHSRGAHAQAYDCAARYASAAEFDEDLFVLALLSLYQMCRYEEAGALLDSVGPDRSGRRADLANVAALIRASSGRLDAARQHIDHARQLAPHDPVVAANALEMYFELGESEAYERILDEIRQARYERERIAVSLAVTELAQDHYREGFSLLESRYHLEQYRFQMNPALLARPRWQGEPLAGKTVLISAEQGLGDTVQFVRYLPEFQRLTGCRVVLETPPETITLLQESFPDVPMIEHRHGVMPATHFDCWVATMSLPHLCGTTAETVPGRQGYLRAPADNAAYWRDRVAELTTSRRPRIGLAWSGKPSHPADRRRSIHFASVAERVRAIDADFLALQREVPAARPDNMIDVSDELLTLADTAALIDLMDLVITVDTCPVHLAGALGKETWLMLPYRYEWRWSMIGEANRWYDSVRVLRQCAHGDWAGVLDEVFGRRLPDRLAGGPA